MYDSFFQYRAIRIKTAKGINPVRINKTLVQFAHFIFPKHHSRFPAKRATNWFPFSASSLIPSTMHIVMRNTARRDVGKMGGYAPPDKDTPGCRTFCKRVSCIYIAGAVTRLSAGPWNYLKGVWRPTTLVIHESADRSM